MANNLPPGNRLRPAALKDWLMLTSTAMGTSSPAEVLKNFIRILEGASPGLRLAIALLTPWAMQAAALSSYGKVWSSIKSAKDLLSSTLYATISIPESHPINQQVQSYVAERGLGENARSLALSASQADAKRLAADYAELYYDVYGRARQRTKRPTDVDEDEQPPLQYVPEVGTYNFWWKCYRFTLTRQPNVRQEYDAKGKLQWVQTSNAGIELSCLSLFGGAGPIKRFLKFVQDIPRKERTTTIFRPAGQAWDAGITRPSRTLNAVTLDASVKESLVKDIETYLTPATKRYYANRGIPWRRGFLFYGHPGCGKTSFTNALAGHFKLNVYMLSLSNKAFTDRMLEQLFEQLPAKCIVLLEDIDSAGIKRENMKDKGRSKKSKRRQ